MSTITNDPPHTASVDSWWRWGTPEMLVSLFAGALLLIPGNYTVLGPLGDVGRPSVLIGLGLLTLWLMGFAFPQIPAPDSTPVRYFMLFYLLVWSCSVAFAYLRGLSPIELRGIERFFILTLSSIGVALAVSEMITTRAAVERLLRRIVLFGAIVGAIGALQFYAKIDLVRLVPLPLPVNDELDLGLATRGATDLTRASSTMQHAIELSVVSAMLTPLALHFAFADNRSSNRWRSWSYVALCAVGIPLSVSRSGILAGAIVLIVLLRCWRRPVRIRALAAVSVAIVFIRITTPGLVGTIIAFFTNFGADNSVEGRTKDYEEAARLIGERPLLGLGGGTFRPEQYFVLDNYVLEVVIATGLIGLVSFLVLFLGPYSLLIRTARASDSFEVRHLSFALGAALLAGLLSSLTWDSMNFPGFTGLAFLFIGSAGVLWRTPEVGVGEASFVSIVRPKGSMRPILQRVVE